MDRFDTDRPVDIKGDYAADAALMRRLAGRYAPRGRARLGLRRRALRRLEALLREAGRLRRTERVGGEALARLDSQGRVAAARAKQALSEGGARMPAWQGRPRIEVALRALCAGGELTCERLLRALRELDAVQRLTMEELWSVPEALRTVLAEGLLTVAEDVVRRAGRRARARRWAHRPTGRLDGRDAAFLAHALRCAGEEGLSDARRRLDEYMVRRGITAEALVARAQADEAGELLRLESLLASERMLEQLNWRACFEVLSRVERELQSEAAGVYSRMDEDSRGAVRRQVAHIARRTGLCEPAVARCAVDAARTGVGERAGVCWWLYDDEGRRALLSRLGREGTRIRRMVPDPQGRRTVAALLGLTAALTLLFTVCVGNPWLWAACVPLGWTSASALAGRFYSRFAPPARLLKLELEAVPEDCRTLVTMPVLLSSPRRVESVCDQLEALGCLEKDENIEYLLLGDFADAAGRDLPEDGEILSRARERVAAMNMRAGREKYALLCRSRTLLKADSVWMGRDRKRGALADLNRLLLGRAGAEAAFDAEGAACGRLKGSFRYVLTLDADTRLLPGDVRRLIGAMAHPLNRPERRRGYAVLQPRMETLPSACVNAFVRLFAGLGGVNTYPISVSNLWQDLTGRGIYGGKGIYDVEAFQGRLEGKLPEGRILSHDLAEGAFAGAGFVGDVAFYDGHPTTLAACLARRHRWIRGDWQLLPVLFSRGNGLGWADRFRMLDNLVRSLREPALLALLTAGVWTGGAALGVALAVTALEPALRLGDADALKWRRAIAELASLPTSAWNALDAVGRTLWRLGVSGKRLLEWVTAADAEQGADRRPFKGWPPRVAALLLAPGLAVSGWASAALALGILFWIAPGWFRDMEEETLGRGEALSREARAIFARLAQATWRFFEDNMPDGGSPLPPDNVQLDPPVGAARRTSPTNIALYMLSCLSARRLGFIGVEEARRRLTATTQALERLEKWRGQLYNWYDIDTLAPLRPRYVSSVDSGNLAAALLLCANAAEAGEALAPRLRALAEGMDLAALYDGERELFFIGMDVETGRVSASHYDLLASEARILSFAAMMLGQVSPRHWRRLGRTCVQVEGGVAPLSWSGTLFEYMMPELLLAAPVGSMLGEGVRAAVKAQMEQGRRTRRPWGVSESGYCALDAALNYQYRAFGLRALALDGEALEGVVAPYATALAAVVAPLDAARNLERMEALGWWDDWGLYEAADYLRGDEDGNPAIVKSHMAHHQGMALCALCNALTGDSLRSDFTSLPEYRALSLLMEEAPCPAARRESRREKPGQEPVRARSARRGDTSAPFPQTHLLYGGGASALCADDGAVHYRRDGFMATRFSGVLQNRSDAARVYLTDEGTGAQTALDGSPLFEPGVARYGARVNGLEASMAVAVSPEDGALLRVIDVANVGARPARCAVTEVSPVALAREADWQAHAVFQNLFVESSRPAPDALLFRRRPGGRGDAGLKLAQLALGEGDLSWETDYAALAGRTGNAGRATRFDRPLSGGLGATLNPVGALRLALTLQPGQRARVCFVMGLLDDRESPEAWLARWREAGRVRRALKLAGLRAGTMLDFVGLASGEHHLLQRLAALLADGGLAAQARGPRRGEGGVRREKLWPLGISGDRPILVMSVPEGSASEPVRELIRAHEFYRAVGLEIDLALVDDGGAGYARPVRDRLEALVCASHLNRLRGVAGGVWLIDGGAMEPDSRRALFRFASAAFSARWGFYAQARALLENAGEARRKPLRTLDAGESLLAREALLADNGYGGFTADGGYAIDLSADRLPPAPWCNILANEAGGMLLSERGGGFFWRGNSREGRLTPYGNDALREGWGLMLYLVDDARGEALRLLPGDVPQVPFRARHDAQGTTFTIDARRLKSEVRFAMDEQGAEARIDVALTGRGLRAGKLRLVGYVEWLMGANPADAVALNCWQEGGACLATGAMAGVGWFAAADPLAQAGPGRCSFLGRGGVMSPEGLGGAAGEGWTLSLPLDLARGERREVRLALGWAEDVAAARARLSAWRAAPAAKEPPKRRELTIETPDMALNALVNGFLPHQVRASRVLGRTGLYQPGGAWGFRDQLQDMLALLHSEPERVRSHLLRCAARQFEAGDVLHWWHEPCRGVRTRVSDDMLFLPWVTAAYVEATGDTAILDEVVPYLEDVELPEGEGDVYREMRQADAVESLHGHCMRTFRRANRKGAHGLLLMGAGDWNDGMNRVGAKGAGESVWLSQFAIACADRYRRIAPVEADGVWLWRLGEELRRAVEEHGWDGGWYLRAFDDDGRPLGSARGVECRIDAISQAWAVLAGLDGARCRRAMDAAWDLLVDREAGLIRLLTPPFEGRSPDPGYIRGYPAGVRENGGQYTHGALWLLLALIRMGQTDRAHEALRLLLPFNHSDTQEKARIYRVEPYVMAADVYDRPGLRGRGGWTWYSGAAGWMYNCVLALLGYERRGDRVRLNALLGSWPSVSVTVPFGASRYRLVCDKKAARITLDGLSVEDDFIQMVDDGNEHEARFPER